MNCRFEPMGNTFDAHQPFSSNSFRLSVSRSKPLMPIRQASGKSTVS